MQNKISFLHEREWEFFDPNGCSLELPEDESSLTENFDAIINEICHVVELADSNRKKALPPVHTAKGLLKQLIYQLGQNAYENEETLRTLLIQKIKLAGKRVVKRQIEVDGGNIFHLCFRVFENEFQRLKIGEISKLSQQLLYADEKEVPHNYLIGFIYQTGGLRTKSVKNGNFHSYVGVVKDGSNPDDDDWGTDDDDCDADNEDCLPAPSN